MSSDDHGPATCTYFACNAESDTPCPFLASKTADNIHTDLPKYQPGQMVILSFKFSRMAVLIVAAEQQEDGSWHYFDYKGQRFGDGDVEAITP